MADSAGKGILIVAVCHCLAQLEARWQGAGAPAIWDTAGMQRQSPAERTTAVPAAAQPGRQLAGGAVTCGN
jgi:hypothetical protein